MATPGGGQQDSVNLVLGCILRERRMEDGQGEISFWVKMFLTT